MLVYIVALLSSLNVFLGVLGIMKGGNPYAVALNFAAASFAGLMVISLSCGAPTPIPYKKPGKETFITLTANELVPSTSPLSLVTGAQPLVKHGLLV